MTTVPVDIAGLNPPELLRDFGPLDYSLVELDAAERRNVTIIRSGIAMQGWRLIPESLHDYSHRRASLWKRGLLSKLGRRTRRLPDDTSYGLIHNVYASGYFHWLTETLPRLVVLGEADPGATVLLPTHTRATALQAETVAAMGWTRTLAMPARDNVLAPRLTLVRNPPKKGEYDPRLIRAARDQLARHYGAPAGKARLYVSRKAARGRRVVNEDAVEALLARRGFTTVTPESLSFGDQVRLFGGAQALVTIHGAGLTNMLFMPEGGSVVEFIKVRRPGHDFAALRRSDLLNPSYPRLASALGHRYVALPGNPDDAERTDGLANLTVDTAALAAALDRLGL